MRLKERPFGSLRINAGLFQFHIGAIKRTAPAGTQSSGLLFQFHIGAIKSYFNKDGVEVGDSFQFHIGAIKRKESGDIAYDVD